MIEPERYNLLEKESHIREQKELDNITEAQRAIVSVTSSSALKSLADLAVFLYNQKNAGCWGYPGKGAESFVIVRRKECADYVAE